MMPVVLAVVIAMAGASPAIGQTAVRRVTPLLAAPGGRELATIRAGTPVRAAAARQGYTQVTLDGYIDASLVGRGRDSFPNTVRAQGGARLREAGRPAATILADLRDGMGLTTISRQGDWIRIRRTGWVATSSLGPAVVAGRGSGGATPPRSGSTPPTSPATTKASSPQEQRPVQPGPSPVPPAPRPAGGTLTPVGATGLWTSPNGDSVARLDSGAVLVPLARENGWTRVRIEGWVRDAELIPADSGLRLSLSAADIRADPARARGAVVRWDIEFIALQRADALRPDMRPDETYMLARGPDNESSLLYLVVPPALLPDVQRLESLSRIIATARVRVGRSEPVGVPILDLMSIARP